MLTLLNLTRDGAEAQISPLKSWLLQKVAGKKKGDVCVCMCVHLFVLLCLNKLDCLHIIYADMYNYTKTQHVKQHVITEMKPLNYIPITFYTSKQFT